MLPASIIRNSDLAFHHPPPKPGSGSFGTWLYFENNPVLAGKENRKKQEQIFERVKKMAKKKTVTMADIEQAIDKAAAAVKVFKGARDELIVTVINPLQVKLKEGTKAGLYCTERRLKSKFRKLEKSLREFDERPSGP